MTISNLNQQQSLYNSSAFSFPLLCLGLYCPKFWVPNQEVKICLFFTICEFHDFLLSIIGFSFLNHFANIIFNLSLPSFYCPTLRSPSLQSTLLSDYPACYTNVNFKNRALLIKIHVGFSNALRSLRIKSKIHTRPSIFWPNLPLCFHLL